MSGKIFINYRRDDSAASALGIGQYLAQEFGRRNVFIDVDIGAGAEFPVVLERRLAECKVLLAVIGPNWLERTAAEPERTGLKIDGTSTYDIVRQIRCETRASVTKAFIGWLVSLSTTGDPVAAKLLAHYESDPASIKNFQSNLFKGKDRAYIKSFYDVGIAYSFNQEFTQTDTFGGLLTDVDENFCRGFTSAANAGGNSIDKLLTDFIKLSLDAGNGSPLVRELMYTTGTGRTEKVTVGLAMSSTKTVKPGPGRKESTGGGSPVAGGQVSGGGGLSEKEAVTTIDQIKSRIAQ